MNVMFAIVFRVTKVSKNLAEKTFLSEIFDFVLICKDFKKGSPDELWNTVNFGVNYHPENQHPCIK